MTGGPVRGPSAFALPSVWRASGRPPRARTRGSIENGARPRRAVPTGPAGARTEFLVLDVVYVLGIIVLFALVALVAKAVEKL